jgi:hypothetical protein
MLAPTNPNPPCTTRNLSIQESLPPRYTRTDLRKTLLVTGIVAAILLVSACTTAPEPYRLPTSQDPTGGPKTLPTEGLQTYQQQTVAAVQVTPTPTIWVSGTGTPASSAGAIDPLTGLPVADPALLQRRPILVKVQNLPRPRLQWGLTRADHVYEYYTEQGTTRFAAVFYGQNAEQVAPIRSARFVDMQLIQMYKAIFVFGSAYKDLLDLLFKGEYASRLLLEQPDSCPAICRYDPNEKNFLTTNTKALQTYVDQMGIDNSPQDLSGYTFSSAAPGGGEAADQIYVRYSGAIYNRWDFDAGSGRYLRFSDQQDDLKYNNEVYEPLVDQLNGQQVGADTLVFVLADYQLINKNAEGEVYDIKLLGSGMAYAARDGRLYTLTWKREKDADLVQLYDEYGNIFPLKPGQTWFELLGYSSNIKREGSQWRFTFYIP